MHVSGDKLAHYLLKDRILFGTHEVWSGVDTRDDRAVTLAILPHLCDPAGFARAEAEAKALASVTHPGVAKIAGVEQVEHRGLLLMETLDGTSLAKFVGRGGMEPERLLADAVQLVDAVCAAHDAGVTHRELAPDRVYVTGDGTVRVHGFGFSDAEARKEDSDTDPDDTPTLTLTREGGRRDLAYLAPEQIKNQPLDRRTDVYALGAVLHWMACGLHPFRGDSPADLFVAVLRDRPRPVNQLRHDVPEGLVPVIARCLEKDRDKRYPSAGELRAELSGLA